MQVHFLGEIHFFHFIPKQGAGAGARSLVFPGAGVGAGALNFPKLRAPFVFVILLNLFLKIT